MSTEWRKCGVCKKSIPLGGVYQKCSISSCRKFAFCSVDCWSVHDSVMAHKSSYAEEERAPMTADNNESGGRRRIVATPKSSTSSNNSDLPDDVLIVVSKLKAYVKALSGMNTSGDVADELSKFVRVIVKEGTVEATSKLRTVQPNAKKLRCKGFVCGLKITHFDIV